MTTRNFWSHPCRLATSKYSSMGAMGEDSGESEAEGDTGENARIWPAAELDG